MRLAIQPRPMSRRAKSEISHIRSRASTLDRPCFETPPVGPYSPLPAATAESDCRKPAACGGSRPNSDIWPAAVHDQYGIDAVGLNRPDSWCAASRSSTARADRVLGIGYCELVRRRRRLDHALFLPSTFRRRRQQRLRPQSIRFPQIDWRAIRPSAHLRRLGRPARATSLHRRRRRGDRRQRHDHRAPHPQIRSGHRCRAYRRTTRHWTI